jgi:uncharacterized protein (TIGR03435 family)
MYKEKNGMTKSFLCAGLTIVLASCGAAAQAFEVASVKLNVSGQSGSHVSRHSGEVSLQNVSLREVIGMAYEIQDFGISGPDWMASEKLDIVAKPPAAVGSDQLGKMLQALLAERFKLSVHREPKTVQAYALVVAKGGLKMKETEAGPSHTSDSRRQLTAQKVSIKWLADWLSLRLSGPVVDQTETKGSFDFTLQWTPEGGANEKSADNPAGPSIFSALQEQLGLRLQAQKLPVEVVVVDHVEKVPTEN